MQHGLDLQPTHLQWLQMAPPGGQAPGGNSQTNPKVAQHVALATKQLLINYSPLDAGEVQHC